MDNRYTIEFLETETSRKIFPELKEHLDYCTKVYNFCFEIQHFLNEKTINSVGKLLRAQMMLLMRITDFLRCIEHNVRLGYPEQAGSLAASIFELAHTGIYFAYDEASMKIWLDADDRSDKHMPKLMGSGINTYMHLVSKNYGKLGMDPKQEKLVYEQLCWMKHSHPKMQDIKIINTVAKFLVGPYEDERSINHAWFVMEQSGRLAVMLISKLQFPEALLTNEQCDSIVKKIGAVLQDRAFLIKKFQARFQSKSDS